MTNFFFNLTRNKPTVFFLIAGPCVIEDYNTSFAIAKHLKQVTQELGIPYIFKASYDKANRTSIQSFRGPGSEQGLEILKQIKTELDIPVISDIHLPEQAEKAAQVLDVIQPEEPCAAFDGVDGPEHLVDQFGVDIRASGLDLEEVALDIAEVVLGLLDKELQGFIVFKGYHLVLLQNQQ